MPIGFLSDAERERLDSFPTQITRGDIVTYFTLSRADRGQIPRTISAANRLGFALQLGALRYLGFKPGRSEHRSRGGRRLRGEATRRRTDRTATV